MLTKQGLVDAIANELRLTKTEGGQAIDALLRRMADTIRSGQNIKIRGFGSFSVKQYSARIGRNPRTGEEVPVLPCKVIRFKAAKALTDAVNGK